jgi:hypothetical protein
MCTVSGMRGHPEAGAVRSGGSPALRPGGAGAASLPRSNEAARCIAGDVYHCWHRKHALSDVWSTSFQPLGVDDT